MTSVLRTLFIELGISQHCGYASSQHFEIHKFSNVPLRRKAAPHFLSKNSIYASSLELVIEVAWKKKTKGGPSPLNPPRPSLEKFSLPSPLNPKVGLYLKSKPFKITAPPINLWKKSGWPNSHYGRVHPLKHLNGRGHPQVQVSVSKLI